VKCAVWTYTQARPPVSSQVGFGDDRLFDSSRVKLNLGVGVSVDRRGRRRRLFRNRIARAVRLDGGCRGGITHEGAHARLLVVARWLLSRIALGSCVVYQEFSPNKRGERTAKVEHRSV